MRWRKQGCSARKETKTANKTERQEKKRASTRSKRGTKRSIAAVREPLPNPKRKRGRRESQSDDDHDSGEPDTEEPNDQTAAAIRGREPRLFADTKDLSGAALDVGARFPMGAPQLVSFSSLPLPPGVTPLGVGVLATGLVAIGDYGSEKGRGMWAMSNIKPDLDMDTLEPFLNGSDCATLTRREHEKIRPGDAQRKFPFQVEARKGKAARFTYPFGAKLRLPFLFNTANSEAEANVVWDIDPSGVIHFKSRSIKRGDELLIFYAESYVRFLGLA